jgi:hypothetical protein
LPRERTAHRLLQNCAYRWRTLPILSIGERARMVLATSIRPGSWVQLSRDWLIAGESHKPRLRVENTHTRTSCSPNASRSSMNRQRVLRRAWKTRLPRSGARLYVSWLVKAAEVIASITRTSGRDRDGCLGRLFLPATTAWSVEPYTYSMTMNSGTSRSWKLAVLSLITR